MYETIQNKADDIAQRIADTTGIGRDKVDGLAKAFTYAVKLARKLDRLGKKVAANVILLVYAPYAVGAYNQVESGITDLEQKVIDAIVDVLKNSENMDEATREFMDQIMNDRQGFLKRATELWGSLRSIAGGVETGAQYKKCLMQALFRAYGVEEQNGLMCMHQAVMNSSARNQQEVLMKVAQAINDCMQGQPIDMGSGDDAGTLFNKLSVFLSDKGAQPDMGRHPSKAHAILDALYSSSDAPQQSDTIAKLIREN